MVIFHSFLYVYQRVSTIFYPMTHDPVALAVPPPSKQLEMASDSNGAEWKYVHTPENTYTYTHIRIYTYRRVCIYIYTHYIHIYMILYNIHAHNAHIYIYIDVAWRGHTYANQYGIKRVAINYIQLAKRWELAKKIGGYERQPVRSTMQPQPGLAWQGRIMAHTNSMENGLGICSTIWLFNIAMV